MTHNEGRKNDIGDLLQYPFVITTLPGYLCTPPIYGFEASRRTHVLHTSCKGFSSIPRGGQGAQCTVKESVVEPSGCPRRFHQLGLQVFIRQDALDKRVAKSVAFGMSSCCPVKVEERHLTFRVGHRLSVDEERCDLHCPLLVSSAASGLGVLHAPRFDGGHYPFVVRAAAFARDVLQHAFVDTYVVVALLARAPLRAVASSCRHCGALGCPITTKDGDQTGAFDECHHIFGSRRTPEKSAPDPQQDRKGELDKIPVD